MPPDIAPLDAKQAGIRRFGRFLLTGGIGFAVDATVLSLLISVAGLGPIVARVLSVAVALTATWLINRNFTFAPSARGVLREGARYGGIGIGTSLFNVAIYSGLVTLVPAMPPLAALVAASAAAMAFSWFGYSRLVFDRNA